MLWHPLGKQVGRLCDMGIAAENEWSKVLGHGNLALAFDLARI
jgi:hypothetical protein